MHAGAPEWQALVARASQKARKVQAMLRQGRAKSVRLLTCPSPSPVLLRWAEWDM